MNDLAIPIEGCGGLFHMRQFAGVITFRIGDLGFVLRTPTLWAGSRFRIENTKTKLEKHLRIPQSALPNPQSSFSSTPKKARHLSWSTHLTLAWLRGAGFPRFMNGSANIFVSAD
jgi:hypothetical protein